MLKNTHRAISALSTIILRLEAVHQPHEWGTSKTVRALPGICILPGEELHEEYGRNSWLDLLPHLSADARRECLLKFKYKQCNLSKAVTKPVSTPVAPAQLRYRLFFLTSVLLPQRPLHLIRFPP